MLWIFPPKSVCFVIFSGTGVGFVPDMERPCPLMSPQLGQHPVGDSPGVWRQGAQFSPGGAGSGSCADWGPDSWSSWKTFVLYFEVTLRVISNCLFFLNTLTVGSRVPSQGWGDHHTSHQQNWMCFCKLCQGQMINVFHLTSAMA